MEMTHKSKSMDKIDFEKAMSEIERIVNDLESGDLTLDESIKAFEQGIQLSKLCQKKLEVAEERVKKLLEKTGGEYGLELFEDDERSHDE
jgi:exodeoxyribonuclease VII small subunit